jgi:hypothetical protein
LRFPEPEAGTNMTTIEDAYRKFSTKRFPLPNREQLDGLEQRIRVAFPEDYRRFILEFNGGYFNDPEIPPVGESPPSRLACLSGIGASHWEAELGCDVYLSLFDDNDPPRILPIGHAPTGGLIILSTRPESHGAIFFKQAYGDFYHIADGIEEFFGLLREPTWS